MYFDVFYRCAHCDLWDECRIESERLNQEKESEDE